jgi:hypothetical protein
MEITREDLLNELHAFRAGARLIDHPSDLPSGITLPPQWSPILSKPFGSISVAREWQEWDEVIKKSPNIGRFLCSILLFNSVIWDQRKSVLYLLYVFTSHGGSEINFYGGRAPAVKIAERIGPAFNHFPPELRHFYLNLHDGWTFLPSNAMGPLALDDCAFLSDDKFDFDDEKAAIAPFDPNKVLTIFSNGAGDYLCLNFGALQENGEARAMIWWHEEPTRLDFVDFWPIFDTWIGIFLEDADHN